MEKRKRHKEIGLSTYLFTCTTINTAVTLAFSHCVFSCTVWCDVSRAPFIINGILVYSCACWAWGGSDRTSVWLEWALVHWCVSTCVDCECAGTAAACICECPYLSNREVCGESKEAVMCGSESVGYIVVYLRHTQTAYSYYHRPHCYRRTDSHTLTTHTLTHNAQTYYH